MDSLTLTPIPVHTERSEAESKDVFMLPVPIVQRFLKFVFGERGYGRLFFRQLMKSQDFSSVG